MSNVCECKEEMESRDGQLTLMDLYTRLNKLELENDLLKINNYELQKDNGQLRSDNQELHNRLNKNNEYSTVVDGNDDLSYIDEYAKGLDLFKDDYKIGGNDIKNQ
jgi:hypothetical protein